jgi:hypothetical protein
LRYVKGRAWKLLSGHIDGGHEYHLNIPELAVPTRLPEKRRAKSIRVSERNVLDERGAHDERHDTQSRIADARKRHRGDRQKASVDTIDWLALWALSLGFSAMFMAALVYNDGDSSGAAAILFGTACIIAVALGVSKAPDARD